MVYFIGGAPRVGKTTLARLILKRDGIPFMPADALRDALDRTYPDLGMRSGGWEGIPDRVFPYLRELVRTVTWQLPEYVLEGDSFFPEHVRRIEADDDVRAVFLGMSEVALEDIIANEGYDDWVGRMPEAEQEGMPSRISSLSSLFQTKAADAGLPYFDLSLGRERQLEAAYSALMGSGRDG
jgi:hypothetical protein